MNHGIYFSEIFVLQHTDQNPTKNELIVFHNKGIFWVYWMRNDVDTGN